jgi:hypothetical protein
VAARGGGGRGGGWLCRDGKPSGVGAPVCPGGVEERDLARCSLGSARAMFPAPGLMTTTEATCGCLT